MSEHTHPAARLLRPESSALVVIDLQQKLLPAIDGSAEVLANARKLIEAVKILSVPVLLTTQYEKGLGPTDPAIAAAVGAAPLDKVCFGCFGDGPFRAALRQAVPPGSTLLLVGVETHICVMQTALGALEDGYEVHVAADAVGSRRATDKAVGLDRMREAGAVVSSSETAIYELLGNSARAEFKRVLPLLK